MNNGKIVFIGGGNMARSLIGGLVADGLSADNIHVLDTQKAVLQTLKQTFAVQVHEDLASAVASADVIVLAVKPQQMQDVVKSLATVWPANALLISIAAGIRLADLGRWLQKDAAIVRAMPNTPSLVQAGATALFANNHVSEQQREQAEAILRAVGLALWLDNETKMDAVTALSGSGPAYFFLVMEAMENAAIELGLPQETARLLCLETAIGSPKMA